ncbi:hypothetical protein MUP38_00575 [Candidatus Bathyarchaeota archaeon]|nr:hypothetical protein [Candidatus Bathyarchaeota archaeon]
MVGFQNNSVFGEAGQTQTGKSDLQESAGANPPCPQCGSKKLWRDGLRYSIFGDEIQRWLCRNCDFRFSDPQDVQRAWSTFERVERIESKSLKSTGYKGITRQIRVKETKNLGPEQTIIQNVPESKEEIKGKLVQFAWKMQQEGYNKETIRTDGSCLKGLIIRGANLSDPESVKEVLWQKSKNGAKAEKATR